MANTHIEKGLINISMQIKEMQINFHPADWHQQYWWGSGATGPPARGWWSGDGASPGHLQQFLTKLTINLPCDPTILLLGIYPRKWKRVSTKDLYMNVSSRFIQNILELEAIQMSINRWLD